MTVVAARRFFLWVNAMSLSTRVGSRMSHSVRVLFWGVVELLLFWGVVELLRLKLNLCECQLAERRIAHAWYVGRLLARWPDWQAFAFVRLRLNYQSVCCLLSACSWSHGQCRLANWVCHFWRTVNSDFFAILWFDNRCFNTKQKKWSRL